MFQMKLIPYHYLLKLGYENSKIESLKEDFNKERKENETNNTGVSIKNKKFYQICMVSKNIFS